jgi:hypothetical protein
VGAQGPIRLRGVLASRLRPAAAARITGGLWADRRRVVAEAGIPSGFEQLERAGNFHNLRLAAGATTGDYRGAYPFLDSDLYKWLEAVAWLQAEDRVDEEQAARLTEQVDFVVDLLRAAQQPDGYLQSYFQVVEDGARYRNLEWGHEMYCAGHLIQAAVAHQRATGRTDLLDIARKLADHLCDTFGPGRKRGVDGHPEIETALVELYRGTGEARYLELAGYFVDGRGHGWLGAGRFGARYWQDHEPVRTATEVTGHAVRQLYLLAGVVDVYLETGESDLLAAAERLWDNLVATQTYLTGGVGAHHTDEAFGDPHELPPERAYTETCAAIASVMFSWRLLLATGKARYADLIERTLYNGFLAGLSLSGQEYRYVNPLHVRGGHPDVGGDSSVARQPWLTCACCPPNIMRLLASLHHYAACSAEDGLVLHQYMPGGYVADTEGGQVSVLVRTDYPWHGSVKIQIGQSIDQDWMLALRIPQWANGYRVYIDDEPVSGWAVDGWLRICRRWWIGDTVRLELDLPARFTEADPRVDAVRGCLAIERGPLVYCVEAADHGKDVDLDEVLLDPSTKLSTVERRNPLGEHVAITAIGRVRPAAKSESWWPYGAPASSPEPGAAVELTAIPYYTWGNREAGPMRVWLPHT